MNDRTFAEVYRAFEDKFRGDQDMISNRQRTYESLVQTVPADQRRRAIDLGSGRGEWLALTREWGFREAVGVEPDVTMHDYAAPGVEIVASDALSYLQSVPEDSVQLISAFHVIEHVTADYGFRMICEMHRVLAEGGVMIIETPNPENLVVGLWSFHLDPTHNRPIPPVLLEFLVVESGFKDHAVVRMNGQFSEADWHSVVARMATLGPDYAVVAVKGPHDEGKCRSFCADVSQGSPADYGAMIEREREVGLELEKLRSQMDEATESSLEREGASGTVLLSLGERLVQLEDQQAQLLNALHEKERMLQSWSWWVTKPLRSASFFGSRAIGRLRRSGVSPRTESASRLRSLLDHRFYRSRADRLVRASVARAHGFALGSPTILRVVRPIVDRSPALKRRLRMLMLPAHLAATIKPFPRSSEQDMLTRTERLAADRMSWAKQAAARDTAVSASERARPRLAYLSPLPPDRSGIADYSGQLLPSLKKFYDVTVICVDPHAVDPDVRHVVDVQDVAWFEANAGEFDRIVYHIGNSLFHHHMLPLLRRIPGVVVLHDFYLSGMLAYLELYGEWGPVWTRALLDSHGYPAVVKRLEPGQVDASIDAFPASFDVISQATGVITHSEFGRSLGERFYPACRAQDWAVVPLCRAATSTSDRTETRRLLGIAEDSFVVSSFGFVVYTKLAHRLLDAWLDTPMADDPSCHLLFVGATDTNAYSADLLERIRAKGQGRVRITGFVDQDDYARHLACADVGVQLRSVSRGESSAAVLDCMVNGLPTIINANGSMAELPNDCVVLLEEDFTHEDLKAALIRLREDTGLRAELGANARNHVQAHHSTDVAARQYSQAIEQFYSTPQPLFDHRQLIQIAREASGAQGEGANRAVPSGALAHPTRQLLVDVSAMVQVDLRTGIQRVVRAVLLELFQNSPRGFRIEPVWLNNENGQWRYHYARRFTGDLLSGRRIELPDEPVEAHEGDIFLGLDFFAHGVIGAWSSGVFESWRRKGVQLNFVVYDVLPLTMPQYFPDDSTRMHDMWMNALCDTADRLICISSSVADDVGALIRKQNAPRASQISVVSWTLGADLMASAPSTGINPAEHERLQRISDKRSFLMVGTIEPRKGHKQVLEAFEERWAKGSDDVLVLVGSAGWKGVPISQSRGLPDLIRRLREHPELGKRLVWFEAASDELLEKVYGFASALISASEGEGFGLPLVEGAQRGVPLIVRDIPVFREVAGKYAFFFKVENGRSLADELDRWTALYEQDAHPKPDAISWLTWRESAEMLWEKIRPQKQ